MPIPPAAAHTPFAANTRSQQRLPSLRRRGRGRRRHGGHSTTPDTAPHSPTPPARPTPSNPFSPSQHSRQRPCRDAGARRRHARSARLRGRPAELREGRAERRASTGLPPFDPNLAPTHSRSRMHPGGVTILNTTALTSPPTQVLSCEADFCPTCVLAGQVRALEPGGCTAPAAYSNSSTLTHPARLGSATAPATSAARPHRPAAAAAAAAVSAEQSTPQI